MKPLHATPNLVAAREGPSPVGRAPERKPTARKIIAVVGAENPPGLGLIRALLEDLKGEFAARAIVRDLDSPESRLLATLGADLAVADPRDDASLTRALFGAYGAFYIQLSSEHPSRETKLATARAVAGAAKAAGLRHVVWATLEDPGQTFLEHNDVTPTFQNGRWISEGETEKSPEQIFADLAVPTTFLHTAWEASVAAGKWTEDIGRHAYGILRNREAVGETVSISAARLIRRLTPPPAPGPAVQSPVGSGPAPAAVAPPSQPLKRPLTPVASSRAPVRRIAIGAVVAATALLGLVVLRQIQHPQAVATAPEPVEIARSPEPVPAPPVAQAPALYRAAEPSPAATVLEATPPPAENARPEELAEVAGPAGTPGTARHIGTPPKIHRREPPKPGPAARPTPPPPRMAMALAPRAPVVPARAEPAPRSEGSPEHAPAAAEAPAPTVVAVVRAPAPGPLAPAPTPSPLPSPSLRRPDSPPPGFVDPKAVSAVVRGHAAEANACYERAVMEHPDLHGRLTIHALIDPTGQVISLFPTSGIDGGARLQSCLVAAFKSWAFPHPTGGFNGNVTYSFSFESR
jgi:NmrA-like family